MYAAVQTSHGVAPHDETSIDVRGWGERRGARPLCRQTTTTPWNPCCAMLARDLITACAESGAVAAPARRIAALVGALTLSLGGCASVPPHSAPLTFDVPAAWSVAGNSAAAGPLALDQWWLRFDDPLLGELVNEALQANASVNGAQAALRQARSLRDVSAAGLLPAISGSASAQHSTAGRDISGNSFKVGFDASWDPDVFGGNRSALETAEATARASAASLGEVRVSIAAEVALAYLVLRGTQARLAIAIDNLDSQDETLQITQWRLQAGLVTALDTEQARAAAEQTRSRVPALQTAIAQASQALAVLTGQPPVALSSPLAAPRPIPQAADDLALGFPAEMLRLRPDVRAAEQQVTAAWFRIAQAEAARAPAFRLNGSLGLAAVTLGSLTSAAAVVSTLLAGVTMPLFDGGAGLAQVRAQEAALDQAQWTYQAVVLAALKDVEGALIAQRGDRERLVSLQHAAEAAANAALMARQRYSSGLIDFQTVLETERTRLTTQDSVAIARADLGADQVRLYQALGGGWRPDLDDATPSTTEASAKAPTS
jgi:multidrug efflux system outer membrane protein